LDIEFGEKRQHQDVYSGAERGISEKGITGDDRGSATTDSKRTDIMKTCVAGPHIKQTSV